jgi:hypothetical protein
MALWTPAEISTALWLDASDSSTLFDATTGGSTPAADGTVARWEDKSGNSRHVTQGTSDYRPIRKTSVQNSLDVVRFDGTDDLMVTGSNSPTLTGFTVFAVERHTGFGGGGFGRILEIGVDFVYFVNATTGDARSFRFVNVETFQNSAVDSATINTWRVAGVSHDLSTATEGTQHKVNGSVSLGTHSGVRVETPEANSVHQIGNRTNRARGFAGDFGEILYAPVVLASSVIEQIEGYLAHKWGLAGSLPGGHPYKDDAPTIEGEGGVLPVFINHYRQQGIM